MHSHPLARRREVAVPPYFNVLSASCTGDDATGALLVGTSSLSTREAFEGKGECRAGRGREASDWLFIPARHIRRVGSKRAALAISMLQPRPLIPLPPPPPFPAPIRRSGRGSAPAPARLRAHVRLTVWAAAFAEYGDGSLVGILRSFRKSFSLADGSVAGDDGAVVTGNFCVSDFLLSGTTMDFSLY